MRPKQWIKNGFVLAPLLFTGSFLDRQAIFRAFLALVLFCIGSAAAYIVNDLQDIERDRRHPKKSQSRPLASGLVTPKHAVLLLFILYSLLMLGWFIETKVTYVVTGYVALNLTYSFFLKHQPLLDIFTVAIGFVIRVWAGAIALNVPVSGWMFVTTLCLALYLAAVKRGQELSLSGTEGRKVLKHYSKALMDRYAEMSATCALIFYSMFVMSSRSELVITVPVVLFGLFRYWYVVDASDAGESPTDALLGDTTLFATVFVWVAMCAWAFWPIK